ncbi:hypothetical protein [Candidatus Thioglobus sp.]|jgi:hypothetical protein|uniref:hypothetical protein n=1 Tax=Candidatus Thioglobus sp. TaxID=2026721 RepID=UPI0017797BE0|nr:hypothetical protein [Candidatus Thioglobus sp.]HIF47918.1 hypothetical protein [Candidatus Thioglobus sp.]
MFNFIYAIIGVLIGMAVEPVGRFATHGPAAAPQWTWNKISRAVVAAAMWGFIIFSATFGFEYALYAVLEIAAGVFISYFILRK